MRKHFFRGIHLCVNSESDTGKTPEVDDEDDTLDTAPAFDDTVVIDTDDDDDSDLDMSAEINVDELVAKVAASDNEETAKQREARRKLDALAEQRKAEADLDSTYNINLDDD